MKSRRLPHPVLSLLLLAILAIATVVLRAHWRDFRVDSTASKAAQTTGNLALLAPADRKVFTLSVIRGGAYNTEELARARRTDSVIAAHYAGFGPHPKFQKTPRDLLMYVSYRKSSQVYWSRTKHRIPQGETLISDGTALARARCGNRLSETAQMPVAPGGEPVEEILNTPETPEEPVSSKLTDLPNPNGGPFAFTVPTSLGGAPVGDVLAKEIPVSGGFPASGGYAPGGYFGGVGGGPLSGAGGAVPKAGSTNSGIPATAIGTLVPGGSGPGSPVLADSPSGPVLTHVPSDVVNVVPEPSAAGLVGLSLGLALFLLSRRSRNARFLRR